MSWAYQYLFPSGVISNMVVSEFKFNWDGLQNDIEKLDFSNYVGDSTEYVRVKIPDFAGKYNFHKDLLFPKKFVRPHEYGDVVIDYKNCNWIGAAKHLVSLEHEKNSIFNKFLSISTDSLPSELHKVAYVNRYLLFIRDYLAFVSNRKDIIGTIEKPKIILTHDVDAIRVSHILKLRQFFHNRQWPDLEVGTDINCIKEIVDIEREFSTKSIFFFNASKRYFSLPFIDPSYKLSDLFKTFSYLKQNKIEIGLHAGILSSFSKSSLNSEVKHLKKYLPNEKITVRNHWLSNFKERTWKNQKLAGINIDYSVGFNDKPSMRNSSLISYMPLDNLELIPMILMDGQVHNYLQEAPENMINTFKPFIQELKNVGGIASINFHQRFFHNYYGYKDVYKLLLEYLDEEGVL